VGKPEGMSSLERPRSRWEDNIRMDLGEIGWSNMEWIRLAQDKDQRMVPMNRVINFLVPRNVGKLLSR
jgi:hypothetical protein